MSVPAIHVAPSGLARDTVPVTVVHSPACHFCDDARIQLTALATEFPITVGYLDASSTEGQRLVALHRAPMFPLILVDDQFFSFGRLSSKKLRRHLERLMRAE